MVSVVYFYSKPREFPNYSIPALFSAVQAQLPPQLQSKTSVASHDGNGLWKRLLIAWEGRSRQGDINHVTGDIHFIACLLKRRRTVLTIHDCGFMHHPSPLARFVLKWVWLKLPVWRSKVVTVVSEASKEAVVEQTGCSPDKVRVIPNFVSNRFVAQSRPFNTEMPTLLQIGTAPNKNVERLLNSVRGISCHLHIIGKLSPSQLRLLQECNISYSNTVNATDKEIVEAYRQSDLLCFVSTLEGFGIPILEAQAVGRPVITSNCSAMPEVAGEGACLVNPFEEKDIREGILSIISDAGYRAKLVEAGYENAKRFSLAATVQGYLDVYAEILDDCGTSF